MDRASIGPAPPASERARTPPAAASSAWPDACIRDPTTMARASEGCARTSRAVRAYSREDRLSGGDRNVTQMCVHPLPGGTQIAKFFRRTPTDGSRYDDRRSSHQPPRRRTLFASVRFARFGLTPKPRLVKVASSRLAIVTPSSAQSPPPRIAPPRSSATWPAGCLRKPTRVRLP